MNYTGESLRGGGGCCNNKNKTFASKSFDANPNNFSYEGMEPDFSSTRNKFGKSDNFDGNNDDEDDDDHACWNVTQDESFTMLTGKYESINRDCLENEDDEEYDFLDKYLLSMSPIIEKKNKNRNEKGNKENSRSVPRRPHDVSVKCSDSTEEIIGTPSEVALKLNDAIRNYLPRRKNKIEQEVSKEAAAAMEEEFEKEAEAPVKNFCPDEEPKYEPEIRDCPGTWDRLLKKNVPCSDALTLREIALGRRIKKPDLSVLKNKDNNYESIYRNQSNVKQKDNKEKENCCCAKNRKRDIKKESSSPPPPAPKSCCTKQPRINKNVSFSF